MRSHVHPVEPEELMAYLDGELPVEQATAAAAHLEECRECQILVAEMKSVSEALTAWEIESAEPAINDQLSKALDDRQEERSAARGGSLGLAGPLSLPPHGSLGRRCASRRVGCPTADVHPDL